MDRLVERMNIQGQLRNYGMNSDNGEAMNEIKSRIDQLEQRSIEGISEKVGGQVQQNNARMVELVSQYKDSIEDSIHKENVRCYKNTQAMVEENFSKLPDQISANLNNEISSLRNQMEEGFAKISEENNKAIKKAVNNIMGICVAAFLTAGLGTVGIIVILLWIFRII